ncbi:hypothetical protein [Streptomyces profundus]|uniref:hypothetical protein n=1 Tax=Streptomyces profundus TaxID=2867410 RepID=UPI001D16B85D|nr:hypothetical protein [Streptomyces sp. MA3_2.13]UED86396.1 hypothetical protein K4G22_21210 [Streptomyces sp. MA3_2.13]
MSLRTRTALRSGGGWAAFFYAFVLAYGIYADDVLAVYAWGALICIVLGLWIGAIGFWRASQALRARATATGMADVRIARTRGSGTENDHRRLQLGDRQYELEIASRVESLRGTLRDTEGREVVIVPQLPRAPGPMGHRLRKEPLAGVWIPPGGVSRDLRILRKGEKVEVQVHDASGLTVYHVGRHSLRIGSEKILVRDMIGWRVSEDTLDEHGPMCALVLLTLLFRLAK